MMKFEKVISKVIGEEKIQYGIVFGNEKIVFIKSGAYGGIKGYEDKYLKIAYRLHERMGATVICASNPEVSHSVLDEKAIRWVASQLNLSGYELYFVGTSDGGYQNLILASRFPETVKYLGINSSYIDMENLEKKIDDLPNVDKIFVYGTKDDDYDDIVPGLKAMKKDNLKVLEVEGADHKFTGMLDKFISLTDML
jgi:hypothetical protein